MKESLTPTGAITYSIKAMESGENPLSGGTIQNKPRGDRSSQGKENPEPQGSGRFVPVSPEAAGRSWEKYYAKKGTKIEGLPADERQAIRVMTEAGIPPPPGGGADLLDPDEYTNEFSRAEARFINREITHVGHGRHLGLDFIKGHQEKVQGLVLAGTIPIEEGEKLLDKLSEFRTESEAEEVGRRAAEEVGRRAAEEARYPDYDTMDIPQLREAVRNAPSIEASHFPEGLMRAVMKNKELREMLINKIIFKPFEDTTESNRYQLNIYAQGNLDTLLGFLSREERRDYDYFIKLQTAAELFHTMNVQILAGDIEHFIDNSRRINFQHFSLMQQIQGAPQVMRLYEEKYQEILARDGRITTGGYEALKREVDKTFGELNKAGLIRSAYVKGGEDVEEEDKRGHIMEDWETIRALNVGRAFFNLTLRAAEHIAHSHLERGGRRYVGFPMEDAARVMSMGRWVARRFRIAEFRGAQDFLDMTEESFFDFSQMKKRKLGVNRISQLGGMSVRDLELDGMFASRGMYSSWRNEALLFKRAQLVDKDGVPTGISFHDWLDEKVEWEWDGKKINIKESTVKGKWVKPERVTTKQKRSDWIKQIREDIKSPDQLLTFLTPLIEGSNIGLGVLVRQGMFSEEVAYKARQKLWERVAEVNLPLMINYLSNTSIENGSVDVRLNEEDWDKLTRKAYNLILGMPDTDKYKYWNAIPEGGEKSKWDQFRTKVLAQHTRQIELAAGKNPAELPDDYRYTPEEEVLITEIKGMGKNLAGDLADIMFPYVPFMNDVPFDILDYSGPGETMYKRAIGGDFPNFYKASNAFINIVDNPGGMKPEEILEKSKEIERGIESPQGGTEATERVFAMLSAWLQFNMTIPGKRQMLLKGTQQFLRMPTSPAQKAIGMEAHSLSESDALSLIGQAASHGIISHELYNEMKKKHRIGLLGILWAFIRDIVIMTPAIGLVQAGKEVGALRRAA